MATPADEIRDLRERNNELVQKVQYWKMTAAEKENEKLALMKENNDLRLTLSRIRNSGNVQAQQLDSELQAASERALAHLVRASGEIAKTIEMTKKYMRERQESESSARWSSVSGATTPARSDRVHRVLPLIVGGHMQPVVTLSRTTLNNNNQRTTRSPNRNANVTQRAVPMHMLQDVYIPLTRIDAGLRNNMDSEANNNEDSSEELGLNESNEQLDDSQRMSEDEDYELSRQLDAVAEDIEPEEEVITPARRVSENPLEGPSWLLDARPSCKSLEPDSTTGLDDTASTTLDKSAVELGASTCAYSPTVRRKRASSPRHDGSGGRVLKVLVAKMSLSGSPSPSPSPAKRPAPRALLDAPSPNGATVHHLIVSETTDGIEDGGSGEPALPLRPQTVEAARDTYVNRRSRRPRDTAYSGGLGRDSGDRSGVERDSVDRSAVGRDSVDRSAVERDSGIERESGAGEGRRRRVGEWATGDSDSSGGDGEGRSRRPRKAVTYKEKPLNRKMRR